MSLNRHGARIQHALIQMRMPGDNIHDIAQSYPEQRLQGQELGAGFAEEGLFVCGGAERGDADAGLLVAEEAPEGGALVGEEGAVEPGCV